MAGLDQVLALEVVGVDHEHVGRLQADLEAVEGEGAGDEVVQRHCSRSSAGLVSSRDLSRGWLQKVIHWFHVSTTDIWQSQTHLLEASVNQEAALKEGIELSTPLVRATGEE